MTTLIEQDEIAALSDEKIVGLVVEGDKDFFGELIDRYESKLTLYVKRFTQHQNDVSDVMQVVFIKAYTNLKSFEGARSFNSWIYRIAHNESVTDLKKQGSFHPFGEQEGNYTQRSMQKMERKREEAK